jgi:hypothetical protein
MPSEHNPKSTEIEGLNAKVGESRGMPDVPGGPGVQELYRMAVWSAKTR